MTKEETEQRLRVMRRIQQMNPVLGPFAVTLLRSTVLAHSSLFLLVLLHSYCREFYIYLCDYLINVGFSTKFRISYTHSPVQR